MSLTAQEWARVEVLFPQASTLPSAERAAYLDQHCAKEPRVRQEIEAMLSAADTGDDWLKRPVAVSAPERMADTLPAGTRLGAWEIKALIGHGGMGEVYLAERADGAFSMRAAVKLLKRDLIADRNTERFLRERRVLAGLSHPNIARVLDAGATGDGHPYLVMEYVHGARITDYSRMQALAPKAVVLLMQAVAEAVAEAHRQRIVHRDLKPANVLVTQDGQVKLLDFGIAKLMDEAETTDTLPMTPAYAAPEQILGQEPSPASDVYALGVMLFQLLTQRLPHRREGLPLPVIAASLGSETTERPSQVVFRAEGLLSTAQRLRQAEALSGDLDWIVLRALQADPKRRYQSAGELADDLDRYLEHRPVLARPDSAIYRASRFTQRYPTQVAAVLLAVAALTTGLASALWQANIARSEAVRAERVKEFVLSVFRQQDPSARTNAEALSPAQIMARGLERADSELSSEPGLLADVLNDLGEIQVQLGDPAAGRETLERALRERRARYGADSLQAAETLRKLALALTREGSNPEAESRLHEALAILEKRHALETVEAARVQMLLAFQLDLGKAKTADIAQRFLNAQTIFEARLGSNHPETTQTMFFRGQALEQAREDQESEAVLREAVTRIERSSGEVSARLIKPLSVLAILYKRNGNYAEAERAYARTVDLQRRYYEGHHQDLTKLLLSWADLEQERQQYGRAETLFQEAEAALPASAFNERADLHKERGQFFLQLERYAQAERDLARAVALYRQTQGENSGFTWFVAGEWGRSLAGLGRLAEAEKIQREALERISRIMGPEAYQISLVTDALAETLLRRAKHVEVVALRRRSLALTEKKYSIQHRLTAARQVNLAAALLAVNRSASALEAAPLLDQAIQTLQGLSTKDPKLGSALLARGKLWLDQGNKPAARAALQQALQVLETTRNPDAAQLQEARRLLSKAG